jgi:hypothetical protein
MLTPPLLTAFSAIVLVFTIAHLSQISEAANVAVAAQSGRWSSPDVWQERQLPSSEVDVVIIDKQVTVVVDVNVTISRLVISGPGAVLSCLPNDQLTAATSYIVFKVELLLVENGACFSCGAGDCQTDKPEPYVGHLIVSLGGSDRPPQTAEENVRTMLVQDGGRLQLRGRQRTTGITRLAQHAWAGSSSIIVSDPSTATAAVAGSGWEAGELIAIAPTDYDPGQTEYRKIINVSRHELQDGTSTALIVLDSPLSYSHNGKRLSFPSSKSTFATVDTRAEVALLSRNIVIEGALAESQGLGGDVKITGEKTSARVEWCEFRFLGRRGHLGRYPLHMHGVGGQAYVANVAIHDSYQRGIVLHCTNNANVLDSVVAGVYGFAYMLEDGAEEGNVLSGNLALDVNNAIPDPNNSVFTEHANPAAFWFVNPANTFIGNAAAGVRGVGFSWEMIPNRTMAYTLCPQRVPGYDVRLLESKQYAALDRSVYAALMQKNLVAFRNNSAHSMLTGIWFRGGSNAKVNFPLRQSLVEDFLAWKLRPRQGLPVGIAGANHDGCIHVSGLTQLIFTRVACINSPNAFWSMESNVVDVALLAWVNDTGDNPELVPGTTTSSATAVPNRKTGQAWVVYGEPQTIMNVYVSGVQFPIFQARGGGSLASANTVVAGFSNDGRVIASEPFELLMTGVLAPHVFTDADGSLLNVGPGSRVLSSCSGCADRPDPVIDAYSQNTCVPIGRKVPKTDAYISSRLVNGGVIRGVGAAPLLCVGPNAPTFSIVRLALRYSSSGAYSPPESQIHVFSAFGTPSPKYLRSINTTTSLNGNSNAWFFMPMSEASMALLGGYRIVSSTGWRGVQEVWVNFGPTTVPGQGLSIVLSWLPSAFTLIPEPGVSLLPQGNLGTDVECAEHVYRACTEKPGNGLICACRSQQGQLFLRFASADALTGIAYNTAGRNYLHPSPGLKLVFRPNQQSGLGLDALAFALTHYNRTVTVP